MATRLFSSKEITIQLERELIDDFGQTAFAILRNLIFGSPVGNPTLWQNPDAAPEGYVGGHFRRNWVVSLGAVDTQERTGVDPAGASTLAEGQRTIESYRSGRGRSPDGKFTGRVTTIIIQNNAPYANRLALGFSTQRAAGWVDDEIEAALTVPAGRKDLD